MAAQTRRLVVIDLGHGGHDSGATASHRGKIYAEKQIVAGVWAHLQPMAISTSFELATSHQLAGLDRDAHTWGAGARRRFLSQLNSKRPITLIASIHANASPDKSAKPSGFELLCQEDSLSNKLIYNAMLKGAKPLDLSGNRQEPVKIRTSLAVLLANVQKAMLEAGMDASQVREMQGLMVTKIRNMGGESDFISVFMESVASIEKNSRIDSEIAQSLLPRLLPIADEIEKQAILNATSGANPLDVIFTLDRPRRALQLIPAYIFELGFVTNPGEAERMEKNAENYARGIMNAIIRLNPPEPQPLSDAVMA